MVSNLQWSGIPNNKVILSEKIHPSYVVGFVQHWHILNFVCNFDGVNMVHVD